MGKSEDQPDSESIQPVESIPHFYLRKCLEFRDSIREINIPEDLGQGRILVSGGSVIINEKSLFCTPQSDYTEPNTGVSQVICVDSGRSFKPFSNVFSWSFADLSNFQPDKKAIYYANLSLTDFLEEYPEVALNTILFMRIKDLSDQMDEYLFNLISAGLKPGGYFMASGSSRGIFGDLNHDWLKDICQKYHLNLLSYKTLADVDNSGLPFLGNVGFVVQKIDNIS
jgi:hypothetical protein